jgi:cellulose synthase (UDP-forming)
MLGTPFDLRVIAEKMALLAVILAFILVFANMAHRNRKNLKYFIGFAILLQTGYMVWRVIYTIPTFNIFSLILGGFLFLAELLALLQSTTHRVMFLKDFEPVIKTLDDLDELPTVDILIATYNEPVSILRNTVAAATSQKYPKEKYKVFVCDDGCREEVHKLAEEYGAVWAVRVKHEHAKAGNLNNCLQNYASGDLFAVLDADMITKSTFLERMVGYFDDPKMALVQAPQVFYNPDPFQNNLKLFEAIPNEQDFFMREVLERRSMFNAVLNVGSNAIFRRSAIEDIGWIPVGTITEDMATSMLLQARGYNTTFVNENLAMGLSPDYFADYVVQRDRWCRGNIQVMKKWNPLKLPGLSFMQRLIYMDGVMYWFFGLQKIIYYIGPMLFLLTGIPIYYSDVFTMLLFFVPTYYSASLIFTLFGHKSRTYTWAHIYESALAPYLSISALSELIFSNKIKFSVTPKGKSANHTYFAFRVALPHIFLALLSIISLSIGINKMLTDVNYMMPVYLVNLFWLIYNMLGIFVAIFVCFEKQRFRSAERFIIKDKVELQFPDGRIIPADLVDISIAGCAVAPIESVSEPDSLTGKVLSVYFPDVNLILPCVFLRSRSWGRKFILTYSPLSVDQHTALVNFIFDRQSNGFGEFSKENIYTIFKTKVLK